jgi:hypothetical protein
MLHLVSFRLWTIPGRTVHKFKNNLPAKDCASGFLHRRKADLRNRLTQNIKVSRADITVYIINKYFDKQADFGASRSAGSLSVGLADNRVTEFLHGLGPMPLPPLQRTDLGVCRPPSVTPALEDTGIRVLPQSIWESVPIRVPFSYYPPQIE